MVNVAVLVIFDLDNTLVDRTRFFREWAQLFAAARNLDADEVRWLDEIDEDGLSRRTVLFELARERFGLAESVEELVDAYWRDQLQRYRCDPDTIASLRALRANGYRIGVATNGGSTQSDKIVAAGIDRLVDGWCASREVGFAKPERQIFEALAVRCDASLDGAWVVRRPARG